jgi:mannosyltransferase
VRAIYIVGVGRVKRETGWILLWTILGAVFRLLHLGAPSLWLDELFSVAVARRDWAAIIESTAQDTMPPLYYLLLHIPLQFDTSEIAARSLSALFSILTIPLFYLLTRRLFDSVQIANIATAILAVNPFHIAYAQEARMYAWLAFCQLAGIYFFYRAWVDDRWRDWALFVIAEMLAFYSHSLAVLGLVALDLFALWRWREFKIRWRRLLFAHLGIGVLFAPWLWVLMQQANRVLQGFWNPSSTLLHLWRTVYVFIFNTALPTLLMPIGLTITLLLFVLAVYGVTRALVRESLAESEQRALQLGLAVLLVPPTALLLLSLIRPLYIERVLISASFGVFLLWAWMWTRRARAFDRMLIALGVVLIGVALGNYYLYPDLQKPPMRRAAQLLQSVWQPGEPVLHTSDWTALAFAYYAPGLPNRFLAGDPMYLNETTRGRSGLIAGLIPQDRAELLAGQGKFWLVVALDHSEVYQQQRVDEFDALYRRERTFEVDEIYLLNYRVK